jgi:energy-coupling factor transporter ATP-binding protein EcfA2
MIHVERTPLPQNQALQGLIVTQLQLARSYFRRPYSERQGQRFRFAAHLHPAFKGALLDLFHHKCAYCERLLIIQSEVDHYRPMSGVLDNPDHPGYWWLAGEWSNLLLVCLQCSHSKRNRFPLTQEKDRAFNETDDLAAEMPLLLDPCSDFPEAHLVFDDFGGVGSTTLRGQTTISVLGLNSSEMIEIRRRVAQQVLAEVENITRSPAEAKGRKSVVSHAMRGRLAELVDSRVEFSGMKRQIVRRAMKKSGIDVRLVPGLASNFGSVPYHSVADQRNASRAYTEFERANADYSLAKESDRSKFLTHSRQIERIEICNVKGIRELDIACARNTGGNASWLMLLGENGTGKSTVLQSIAIALGGPDYCEPLVHKGLIRPEDFVRRRCKSGKVSVTLSGFPRPFEAVVTDDGIHFISGTGDEAQLAVTKNGSVKVSGNKNRLPVTLLAYGATRLLPRGSAVANDDERLASIDNLFDPFFPLASPDAWLPSLSDEVFGKVALALSDLLCLPEDARFHIESGKVKVTLHGAKLALSQLSDGYQGVVALTIDILKTALSLWPRAEDAEGVVLLDEIGSHLHPRWQMRIVKSLRRALPGLQFITTTHDPLCLRGLVKGEVCTMERTEMGDVDVFSDLPDPGDFRVDQLLTSQFFGLNSTSDPDTESVFNEYYGLMAKERLSQAQKWRLEELKQQLADRRYFGNTLREQLMFEAVDHLVAGQRGEGRKPMPVLKKEAVDRIAQLWQQTIKGKD